MDDLPEVWCSRCADPSTVTRDERAYCAKHDPTPAPRRVPDAITDPWLRAQYARATGAKA